MARAAPGRDVLVRVEAPHFVAGLVICDDRCVAAAPIAKWAIGKTTDELRAYFAEKGWRAHVVQHPREPPVQQEPPRAAPAPAPRPKSTEQGRLDI